MSDSISLDSPATKIATAQASLAFAIRLNAEIVSGRIRRTIYEREVTVFTGGNGVFLPKELGATKDDLEAGGFNLVILALGASALITDETLDKVFGRPDMDKDTNRFGLRILVNQLRNAFAHDPWQPKWLIHKKFRGVYNVNLAERGSIRFDTTMLDGDGVKPEQIGGFEFWINVLQLSEQLVKNGA